MQGSIAAAADYVSIIRWMNSLNSIIGPLERTPPIGARLRQGIDMFIDALRKL